MHRLLTGCPEGLVVDHINGDSLDNRRSNLRICTQRQNRWNRAKRMRAQSKFKGVWFDKDRDLWIAQIGHDSDRLRLGAFEREEDAARQYDRAARLLFGAFARTNQDMGLLPAA